MEELEKVKHLEDVFLTLKEYQDQQGKGKLLPDSLGVNEYLLLSKKTRDLVLEDLEIDEILKASGMDVETVYEICKNFKKDSGIPKHDTSKGAKNTETKKFFYGDPMDPTQESHIALNDNELFLLVCYFPNTFKERIAIINAKAKLYDADVNYYTIIHETAMPRLDNIEKDILSKYKYNQRKKEDRRNYKSQGEDIDHDL